MLVATVICTSKQLTSYTIKEKFVYVIVQVAVLFGINCASNAGWKLVIVEVQH